MSSETAITNSPLVVIALSRSVLAALTAPDNRARLPTVGEHLDDVADLVILGDDLLTDSAPTDDHHRATGVDPSIAAITLAAHTRSVGLVVAAAPQRDHPYNLARRLSSIDHASNGRVGLAIAPVDQSASAGSPWTSATPASAATDAVLAIRELWQSFPVDSIVAERESGTFARSEQIVSIDHRGAFDIAGPFQVPTSPQVWPPVVALHRESADTLDEVTDVILDDADPAATIHRPADLAALTALLATAHHRPSTHPVTLRERLGLGPVPPRRGGRSAFPESSAPLDTNASPGDNSIKENSHAH